MMVLRVKPVVLATLSFLASCGEPSAPSNDRVLSQSPPTIDVKKLVGVKKSQVDALWGVPHCPPKNACVYSDKREIYYVDGDAANLTLPPVDDLSVYGLDLGEPVFENVGVKRWETTINGRSAEVSQFEDYVYVKTREP